MRWKKNSKGNNIMIKLSYLTTTAQVNLHHNSSGKSKRAHKFDSFPIMKIEKRLGRLFGAIGLCTFWLALVWCRLSNAIAKCDGIHIEEYVFEECAHRKRIQIIRLWCNTIINWIDRKTSKKADDDGRWRWSQKTTFIRMWCKRRAQCFYNSLNWNGKFTVLLFIGRMWKGAQRRKRWMKLAGFHLRPTFYSHSVWCSFFHSLFAQCLALFFFFMSRNHVSVAVCRTFQ